MYENLFAKLDKTPMTLCSLFRSSPGNLVLTNFFDIPFLTTDSVDSKPNRSKRDQSPAENLKMATDAFLSLSDHEAVSASLILYKQKQ